MNKILITGAYGQLGNEIKMLSAGMPGFEFLFTDYDTLDITDPLAFRIYMEDARPDFVVNCAAYTAVDKAEQDQEACYSLNAVAPGIIAGNCRHFSARFIQLSTDYVFDGTHCTPYSEDDPVNPQGVYGVTKREGELSCLADPEVIIIRTSWLYSTFGNNFVKTMLRLGREKDQLNVVFDQVGTPTYAADLAAAVLKIISLSADNRECWKPGIYHYSNEGACSWYDFANVIHHLAGIGCKLFPVETKDFVTLAKRPAYSVLNKSRIKETFGLTIPWWMDSLNVCMQSIK